MTNQSWHDRFLKLWRAGLKANAVGELVKPGRRQGRLKVSSSVRSEISGVIRRLRKNNEINRDDEVLAYSALSDKTSILNIVVGLLFDFSREINLEPNLIGTISKEKFESYVSSVLHISEAQNVVTSHFDDAISLNLSRVAEKDVRPFLEQAKSLYKFDLNVIASAPTPTGHDLRLAAIWTGDPALEGVDFEQWDIPEASSIPDTHQQNWELGRCLSARLAERVAKKMYRRMGYDVEDIASKQLLARISQTPGCIGAENLG